MKVGKFYEIRVCDYPEEKRIRLNMKKYEVYKLLGTHWEYQDAFNSAEGAQAYIQITSNGRY